jgi:hypothetical protein
VSTVRPIALPSLLTSPDQLAIGGYQPPLAPFAPWLFYNPQPHIIDTYFH